MKQLGLTHHVMVMLIVICGCMPPQKTVTEPPISIRPLEKRVYASPGVNWLQYNRIKLVLREKGAPEESRNQILERYLLNQASDCLTRKGYIIDTVDCPTDLRIYFGLEKKASQYKEVLTYGNSTNSAQFRTSINLNAGVWSTSSVSISSWTTLSATDYFEGQISLEFFDSKSGDQLWRGDVFAPLSTRDIRECSNYMFRDLLWNFPTIDYTATEALAVDSSEFELLYDSYLDGREFYCPGTGHHISFDFKRPAKGEVTPGLEAEQEFKHTEEYRRLKRDARPWDIVERTDGYDKALRDWIWENRDRYKLAEDSAKKLIRTNIRYMTAIIDLLQSAPWSYVSEDDRRLHIGGRYVVGADTICIHISGKTFVHSEVSVFGMGTYRTSRYFPDTIYRCSEEVFQLHVSRATEFRNKDVGMIDFLPGTN